MSRDGSDIYSVPPGTAAVSGTPVGSSAYNTFIADLVNDLNTPRPVSMGGTGASTASGALTNLGALPTDADIVAIAALGYAARSTLVKTAANTWTLVPQTTFGDSVLATADAAALRSLLSLVIGTSGDTVPKNNTANTNSAVQTYTANTPIVLQSDQAAFLFKEGGGSDRFLLGIRSDISGNDTDFLLYSLGVGTVFQVPQSTRVADFKAGPTVNGVAIPTISSTDTLSNKTLSSPTLSGPVAGPATFSGAFTNTAGPTTIPAVGGRSNAFLINNSDSGAYGVLIGSESATGAGWIQAQKVNGDTDAYALKLQPNGGDIIGNSTGPSSVYSLGYRGTPQNIQNSTYTFVLADAGKQVHAFSGTPSWTIPPNSSVPYPLGTVIVLLSTGAVITLLEGSGVSLNRGDGASGSGTRTIGNNSIATITKSDTNTWIISGVFT